MKVETVENEFKPLKITLETQDEIDRLFAILNFVPIKNAVGLYEKDWDFLYRELLNRNSPKYVKYHDRLGEMKIPLW